MRLTLSAMNRKVVFSPKTGRARKGYHNAPTVLWPRKLLFSLLASLIIFAPIGFLQAATTRFVSPNYGVESVIFGGTGTLHSSASSIPPVIIAGPTVGAITTSSATVTWVTDKQSNSILSIGTAPGVYDLQLGQLTNTTFTNHSVSVSQLKKGTVYYYLVSSSDVAGNQVESAEKTFTTDPGDVTPPVVTQGPFISGTSATSVTVSWQTDELSSSIVEFGLKGVTESSAGHLGELTLFHEVKVSGLISLQTYLLRIKSADTSGNTYTGPTQTIQTPSAPAITEVTVSDITLNSAVVQWKTTAATTSALHYGTTTGYGSSVDESDRFSTGHLIKLTGLISGSIYHFRIFARDEGGTALTSDDYVFKTVVLPIITNFKVSEITSNSAKLTWDSSSDIDAFINGQIIKTDDPTVLGKLYSAGDQKLVSNHVYLMADLESGATYTVSVIGKDVFGNQALSVSLTFETLPDHDPPQFENVTIKTSVDLGSQKTVQALVSFGLNERGIAKIHYGKGASGSMDQTVETDSDFTLNKFMVIPELEPGNTYHAQLEARDRAGNIGKSSEYLILAPTQPVTIFDLIFGQLRKNFGPLFGGSAN